MPQKKIEQEQTKPVVEGNNVKVSTVGKIKSDFPKLTLEDALRVAQALEAKNGSQPLPPLDMAAALGLSPGNSHFRNLLSSSFKYGLTSGSFNGEKIVLEEYGQSIVEPISQENVEQAMIAASLKPSTFRAIFDYFKDKKLPELLFFQNTIIREYGVPKEHAKQCVEIFIKNMENVGLIHIAGNGRWLRSSPSQLGKVSNSDDEQQEQSEEDEAPSKESNLDLENNNVVTEILKPMRETQSSNNRVFITHGKNKEIVNQLKELLTFGSFIPIIAQEHETVSKPVSDKVLDDMRSCYAAIIHVGTEKKLLDEAGEEHRVLNENVLIEIGAAMALYNRRFILLVERGTTLPSNLQGLYEVRYEGDKLDYEATMKLLKAFNDFKPKS